jgi:hypothetical protein
MEQAQKPPYHFENSGFAVGAMALLAFRWGAYLTTAWGYTPTRGWGLLINFGMVMGIVLLALFADYGLHRAGLAKPVRAGAWFSALAGPYAGMTALAEWGHPVGSQVIGVISTLLAFWVGYGLERRLEKKSG